MPGILWLRCLQGGAVQGGEAEGVEEPAEAAVERVLNWKPVGVGAGLKGVGV